MTGSKSKMGRNPFDKKPYRALDFVKQMEAEALASAPSAPASAPKSAPLDFKGKLAKLILVDVRAESYLLALKTYLLSISLLS